MKHFLFLICTPIIFFSKSLTAQNQLLCSQQQKMTEAMLNPEFASRFQAMRKRQEQNPQIAKTTRGAIYTIPIVFHVLHNGGPENISDAQIIDQVRVLNIDYQAKNADSSQILPEFKSLFGDVQIEFKLAKVAPDGSCFNGITRTISSETSDGDNGQAQIDAVMAGNNVYQGEWPQANYLNIIVCADLGNAAGYTFYPNEYTLFYNSVFLRSDYCGSIGTSQPYTSRALTHEVGHWFNLTHCWGEDALGTCGDDHVDDTPQTLGSTSCNLGENSCGPLANVQNYMDYSYCSKMFTLDQVARMHDALGESSTGRSNLYTAANLELTGVNNTLQTYYRDLDNDGYGNNAYPKSSCTQPAGYSANNTDCNDGNATVHPGAVDVPGDGVDQNCSGADDHVGLEEETITNAVIYPNPGKEQISITLNGTWNQLVSLTVISLDGKTVSAQQLETSNGMLSVSTRELMQGTYLVQLTDGTHISVLRWVKQ